jgi:hypothetical protein
MLRHPKWGFIECSAKMNWNIKNIFEKVGKMVIESEKEREKNVQTSKMKIHPSKLRKNKESSSCC